MPIFRVQEDAALLYETMRMYAAALKHYQELYSALQAYQSSRAIHRASKSSLQPSTETWLRDFDSNPEANVQDGLVFVRMDICAKRQWLQDRTCSAFTLLKYLIGRQVCMVLVHPVIVALFY
jgi:hypothetical protein